MNAVETLREAAKVLRERAGAAIPGPWETRSGSLIARSSSSPRLMWPPHATADAQMWEGQREQQAADATYIATMHPGVALALADWLDAECAVQDTMQPLAELVSVCVEQAGGPAGYVTIGHDDDGNPQMHADSSPAALRVAEAILGGAR